MKRKVSFIVLFAVLMLPWVFMTPAVAAEATMTWKMAGVWGPGDTAFLPEMVAREITQKSGGRLKVNTYPGGQLYGSMEIFGALQKGLIQMSEIPLGYWSGSIPLYKMAEMPFLIRNNKEFKAYLEAGFFRLLQQEAEKVGFLCLGVMGWDDLQAFSRYPVRNDEDVKGRKWRVYTPAMAAGVKALGATPVSMGAPEVYQAMQRGVMDAAFGGVTWAYSWRWHEVGPYITKMDFAMPPTGIYVNKKAFEALPEDLQKIVAKAGRDYMDMAWDLVAVFTPKKYKQFKEEGCTIYELPEELRQKWMDKCKPIWFDQAEKIGPVAKEALDIYFKLFPDRKPK